ncbi:pentapeptide repeat-containing protein [Halobacteria archaeon HArc-gm2]|nr:pentapeptide repeat-containing protein [Halobacteria archaeon HArc-gm2]
MSDSVVSSDGSILELTRREREEAGVSDDDVTAALVAVVERGDADEKVLEGCEFPTLEFDYETLSSENNHPVVFRNCTFEGGISAVHAHVKLPLRFEECTIAGLDLEECWFETNLTVSDSEITGDVDTFEAQFDSDVDFTGTTVDAPVRFDETAFGDDTYFDDAKFESTVSVRGATFAGTSNELDDNASFTDTTFAGETDFRQSTFQSAAFTNVAFESQVRFQSTAFERDAAFDGAQFAGEAVFDEADFLRDVAFDGATFEAVAVFRGAEFEGGARSLEDDARFAAVQFRDDVNFRDAKFRDANFEEAEIDGRAMFERVQFTGDSAFTAVTFGGEADFDEARFVGDSTFADARFESAAVFRGAEFSGDSNHLGEAASFANVRFENEVDFDDATFTSASFDGSEFATRADFSGASFDHVTFYVLPVTNETYVDLTDAVLKSGRVRQPDSGWVRYDLTTASVGDVTLDADVEDDHRQLLDYFRFCNTEFNEFDGYKFDFSAHTDYLDRNDWNLHEFDENFADASHATAMTPETIERTYLKAKTAASAAGQMKAAGEFRVKRQQFARKKYVDIARDGSTDLRTRLKNLGRAAENAFLGVTCGYGMRLYRIAVVFLLAPLIPALLYSFGGQRFLTGAGQPESVAALATPAGQAIFYENLHFSYITFLTIGYGGIGPQGALARMLAGLEVYGSVVLSGLVLYCLIKRSEI